jgi:hypothetical protein
MTGCFLNPDSHSEDARPVAFSPEQLHLAHLSIVEYGLGRISRGFLLLGGRSLCGGEMQSEVEKVEAQYNPGDTSMVVSGCARLPGLRTARGC